MDHRFLNGAVLRMRSPGRAPLQRFSAEQPLANASGTVAVEEAPSHQTIVPRLATQEHRPELCEPCRKWGDCSGWFADPFFVFAAAMFLLDDEGVDDHDLSWQETSDGFELHGSPGLGNVRLMISVRSRQICSLTRT